MMEMKYYNTYYYANIVQNVCENSFSYLRNLDDLFGGEYRILDFIMPFNKKSVLHEFIEFVIRSIFVEEASELDNINCREKKNWDSSNPTYITPLEVVLNKYDLNHENFMVWSEKEDCNVSRESFEMYYEYLFTEDAFDEVIYKLSKDVFYVLFLNREFLQKFNKLLSSYLEGCLYEEDAKRIILADNLTDIVRTNFKLYRKNIPMWVQRAVFFRDRGRCTHCNKDLSGILAIGNLENYDHIVPLNLYGFNDITNIQMLCRECNSEKSGDAWKVSIKYETWY
ncbi:HNH endonuclease signature motif containing protein [Planococcus sp. ISL-109]|uniref:HNH endonuclease n=1 Tax=Planococcus sp. ISL-109 TaxID=2819166 RepID=UPI001BE8D9F7|nr:HNH endonuclease signature motif containing protein [Planococcus sp. ISL-109]MBT2583168.1 HNH endonuclease [Planococcus sp. ISL-109]